MHQIAVSRVAGGRGVGRPPARLSAQHVALMRPELGSMLAEIVAEVCAGVPGYGEVLDGPLGRLIRQCVQRNVSTFVARIADPQAVSPERDEVCRVVGRLEALNGHSMDRLQTAYRIGVQVAWRRWIKVAARHDVPAHIVSELADALFEYIDEMTSLSRVGHAEGRARSRQRVQERRARLLSVLVGGEPLADGTLAELAEQAAWPLPAVATPVVVGAGESAGDVVVDGEALDQDVLADLNVAQPCLVIPGPMTAEREQMLSRFLGTAAAAIGLSVPLSEVPQSVRWARRTLTLTRSADLVADPTQPHPRSARSEDHLLQLWLSSDPTLTQHVAEHQLAPLSGLADGRRERLTKTLLAWLSARGNVEKMSKLLAVHPQTVRYRLRALDKAFGPLLDDPEWRLATELVLRGRAASGTRELKSP